MEAKIEANNKNFEPLRSTLLSRMHIHQARAESIQEEMESMMNRNEEKMEAAIGCSQEEMRAAISSIGAKLEKSMKHQVENVQMSLDHRTQASQAQIEATKTLVHTMWRGLKAKIAEVHRLFPRGTQNC
jgi:DNA polymerase III delta prime subunit